MHCWIFLKFYNHIRLFTAITIHKTKTTIKTNENENFLLYYINISDIILWHANYGKTLVENYSSFYKTLTFKIIFNLLSHKAILIVNIF